MKLFLLLPLLVLGGCTLIDSYLPGFEDRVAKRVGQGVVYYCNEFSAEDREDFRGKVNDYAFPDSALVNCVEE